LKNVKSIKSKLKKIITDGVNDVNKTVPWDGMYDHIVEKIMIIVEVGAK
jgi:hypothetical protein